jgi:hypothetical protein
VDDPFVAAAERFLADPTALTAAGIGFSTLGGAVILAVIVFSVRTIQSSVVVQVPVLGEHAVELARPGGYALHVEGPMFSRMPGGLFFQIPGVHIGGPRLTLRDAVTGEDVPLRAPLLPTRSSGVARARHQIRMFNAPKAGGYVLASDGVDPQHDWSAHRFVVTEPYGFKLMALILAGILGLFTLMAGLAILGSVALQKAGV